MTTMTVNVTPTVKQVGPGWTWIQDKYLTVNRVPVEFPNGAQGQHWLVQSGTGRGAVVIARAVFRGIPRIALVRQHRFPIDRVTMELPRGGTEPGESTVETAKREFLEEIGVTVDPGRLRKLGTIHPDTGIQATEVDVYWAGYTGAAVDWQEPETGAVPSWLTFVGEVRGLIANGEITCGITLAALQQYAAAFRL